MAKMGRKKIVWDEDQYAQFQGMCAIQCTAEEISDITGISVETINRLVKEKYDMTFTECFKKFSAKGKRSLRRNQFNLSKTNAGMAIFLGKQYLGQRDTFEIHNDIAISKVSEILEKIENDSNR